MLLEQHHLRGRGQLSLAKKIISILIIIFLVFSMTLLAFSENDEEEDAEVITVENYDPITEVMPELDYVYDQEYNDNKYVTKFRENYYLDINAGSVDIENGINQITNILFYVQRALVEAMIYIFDQAFTFSFYEIFKGVLNSFIVNMFNSTFGIISSIFLALIGFFFFIKTVKKQRADFFSSVVQIIVVIALAYLYFNNPLMLLKGVDNVVNNVSTTILTARPDISGQTPSDYYTGKLDVKDTGVVAVANNLWEQYIHRPWRIMEFGDSDIADEYEDKVLTYAPGSDQREELINEVEETTGLSTKDLSVKRLGLIIMYLIPMLVNLLLMGALCVLAIGYQFLILIIFMGGIFIFMIALIPSVGTNIVKNWAIKLIGTAGMKILISFLLIIMISFNEALYLFGNDNGWMAALIIQLVIYIIIYIKRESIMEVFMVAKDALQNPKKAAERLGKMKSMEASKLTNSTQNMKTAFSKVRGSYSGVKTIAAAKAGDFKEKSVDLKQKKNASQYLDKKYNWHKQYAEKKAIEKGTEPHYNNFVRKIMEREKNNEKRYTEDELNNVSKRFNNVRNLAEERNIRDNTIKGTLITGRQGNSDTKGIDAFGYKKKGTSHIIERRNNSSSKPIYDPTRRRDNNK
jgi:ABC-type multidrug transport system fused ATPase/permease subunit